MRLFGFLARVFPRRDVAARKAVARAARVTALNTERDGLEQALAQLEDVDLPPIPADDPRRPELLKARAVLLGELLAVTRALEKAGPVKQPGKRGGRYYYTRTGKLRYGKSPQVAGTVAVHAESAVGGVVPTSIDHIEKSTTSQCLLFKGRPLHGRRDVDGLGVSIENRAGSVRYWTDHDGTEGKTRLKFPYGYIRGTQAQDGEEVDCFLGPLARTNQVDGTTVYVVRTKKPPEFLEIDESKCMIGWPDLDSARAAFLEAYSNDVRFIDQIDAVPWDDFKNQVIATKDVGGFIRGDVVERPDLAKARPLIRFFGSTRPKRVARTLLVVALALRFTGIFVGGASTVTDYERLSALDRGAYSANVGAAWSLGSRCGFGVIPASVTTDGYTAHVAAIGFWRCYLLQGGVGWW